MPAPRGVSPRPSSSCHHTLSSTHLACPHSCPSHTLHRNPLQPGIDSSMVFIHSFKNQSEETNTRSNKELLPYISECFPPLVFVYLYCLLPLDNPSQVGSVPVTIKVLDVNDNAPEFPRFYEAFVCENAKAGQVSSLCTVVNLPTGGNDSYR